MGLDYQYFSATCFQHRDELAEAVNEYLQDNSPNTTVALTYGWPIGNWRVSNVADFSQLFLNATDFNEDLSGWDASQALNMHGMFEMATSFNHPLASWNVSGTNDFKSMFLGASSFNQDLSSWDTSSCLTMKNMFLGARNFNGDVSSWNVENCVDMSGMFKNADAFNRDISQWDISEGTEINLMFHDAMSFNQDLCPWGSKIQQPVGDDLFQGTSCPTTGDPDWSRPIDGPFCFECRQEYDSNEDYATFLTFLSIKMLCVLIIPIFVMVTLKCLNRHEKGIDPSDSKLTEFELLHLAEEG
jgi:hypothetical protein